MACWQGFEWVTLAMMPMFLFSTTFFPLAPALRPVLPLYQGIEIVRGLMLGTVAPELLGRAAYLAILGAVGLAVSSPLLSPSRPPPDVLTPPPATPPPPSGLT
jgi:lipooligosaccharide transport system permease protein